MNKTIKQVLQTMSAKIDSKWVSKLSFAEFTINSSVNASTTKSPFELFYRQQVYNVIDYLDGLYRVEGAKQFISDVIKLVAEAKLKLVDTQ